MSIVGFEGDLVFGFILVCLVFRLEFFLGFFICLYFFLVGILGLVRFLRLECVVWEIVEIEWVYVRDFCSIVEDYLGFLLDGGVLGLSVE